MVIRLKKVTVLLVDFVDHRIHQDQGYLYFAASDQEVGFILRPLLYLTLEVFREPVLAEEREYQAFDHQIVHEK